MSLFNKHEGCFGITLFRWVRTNIEIWYCPRGYTIKPHSHNEEDIELIYLFGRTKFFRKIDNKTESATPTKPFTPFTVPAGCLHWFTVSSLPLIFINKATFLEGFKPKSAAIDFVKEI